MRNLYLFVVFLVMYEFSTYSSNDMIMPGMLHVVSEFHAPLEYVSLSLTIFILGNSLLQLFLGPLSEYFGKRRVILAGNGLFLIFTIFLVMSHNIYEFMAGRLLQGSCLGFIAMGYALVHEKFNDKQAVKVCSLMNNISLLAPLLGPFLGVLTIQASSWRYIFIITGFLALVSLIGLYIYTPKNTKNTDYQLNVSGIINTYLKILRTPQFIIGVICASLYAIPIMCWIGLAPNILMNHLGLPMINYALYQLVAISRLSLSAVVMQIVAGRVKISKLIKMGSFMAFGGLALGLIFHNSLNIVVLGMFFYSFGLGISNTLVIRLVMTVPNLPKGMITSLMIFIQTISYAIGIEIANRFCSYYNYSLYGFTLISFIVACLFSVLAMIYSHINKTRGWN